MRVYHQQLLFSATDLVNFLGCRHATFLDRRQLEDLLPIARTDPYLALLQEKGIEHERAHLERLRGEHGHVIEITGEYSLEERTARTRAAMVEGSDVIYQGAFLQGRWHGYADFLLRVPGESSLGPYLYEPIDTKLAHAAKPKHVMQLGVYANLIAAVQGRPPECLHIMLGNGKSVALRWGDFQY
jgi:predicted RecB family nuclease